MVESRGGLISVSPTSPVGKGARETLYIGGALTEYPGACLSRRFMLGAVALYHDEGDDFHDLIFYNGILRETQCHIQTREPASPSLLPYRYTPLIEHF